MYDTEIKLIIRNSWDAKNAY